MQYNASHNNKIARQALLHCAILQQLEKVTQCNRVSRDPSCSKGGLCYPVEKTLESGY